MIKHDYFTLILLYFEHQKQWNIINNNHVCSFYNSMQKNTMCRSFRLSFIHHESSFIFFATIQLCQLMPIRGQTHFYGFSIDMHILNSDEAIAMQFSRVKDWYQAMKTWCLFFKNDINIYFSTFLSGGARSFWLTLYQKLP